MPTVSILIPCYNCVRWVHRSIETALAQTWPDKEVVVLDDGSTDASGEIIERYAGRIRIERQRNSGPTISRNRLTELSHGAWLVYLDADDELSPDSVATQMSVAADADAVYADLEVACFVGSIKTRYSLIPACAYDDPVLAALEWRFPNTSGFMFRRSAVLEVGGWNPDLFNCTDYDLYLRLLLNGARFRPAPGSAVLYRHWSPEQAVYQNKLRIADARLNLLLAIGRELHRRSALDAPRRKALYRTLFSGLRTIAEFDMTDASRRLAEIRQWDADFGPTGASRAYRLAYRLLGFRGAERTAAATRWLPWRSAPESGRDPQSGLVYS